tara:strand:- start:941 stop:1867 length:927 start_codon:yes stop_codon:yes gene_type:complete
MSKIKVDQVESSDTNVKLAPKGSGVLKVKGAGSVDGTLQLSSGSNGVKVKSPPHSSGQSYTMILPDNNIAQDSFLKVKSVSGTGASAIGQLEYATQTLADVSSVDAANFTSGQIPSARINTTGLITAANGYGLKFISKGSVSVDNTVTAISFTNLDARSVYWILGKNVKISTDSSFNLAYQWLDSSNNATNSAGAMYYEAPRTGSYMRAVSSYSYSNSPYIPLTEGLAYNGQKHGFMGEICTEMGWGFFEALSYSPSDSTNKIHRMKSYAQPEDETVTSISGIKFVSNYNGTAYFQAGTEILLYKMES